MLTIKTDTHTHTLCSNHAYSTIEEIVRNGASMGMEAVGITDHFSGLFYGNTDFSHYSHMGNYKALPKEWYGVRLLCGAEADIIDLDGRLFGHDLMLPFTFPGQASKSYQQECLGRLDYVIASVHNPAFTMEARLAETTQMYCKALEHPKVLIIGHIGRAGVPFDMDTVLLQAKALNKMIEINESTFEYPERVTDICKQVAVRCAELDVKIAVGSDAHSSWYVGRFDKAARMLEEIHFPEELIGNRDQVSLEMMINVSGVRKNNLIQ